MVQCGCGGVFRYVQESPSVGGGHPKILVFVEVCWYIDGPVWGSLPVCAGVSQCWRGSSKNPGFVEVC